MRTRLALVLAATLTLSHAAGLPAQQPLQFAPGDRVRLSIPSSGPAKYSGVLLAISADSLVLGVGSTSRMSVPRGAVASLEVSRGGARRAVVPAAVLGAVLGYQVGVAVSRGYTDDPPCTGWFNFFCHQHTAEEKAAVPKLIGAFLGTGGGVLLGLGIDTERWERVAQADLPKVAVVPLSGARLGLGASIRF